MASRPCRRIEEAEKMTHTVPSVSVSYARTGTSTKANELGMRPMQERA